MAIRIEEEEKRSEEDREEGMELLSLTASDGMQISHEVMLLISCLNMSVLILLFYILGDSLDQKNERKQGSWFFI